MATTPTKANGAQTGIKKTLTPPQAANDADSRHLREVLERTSKEKPKAEDVKELRQLLDQYSELWKLAGDFAQNAIDQLLTSASKQALVRESARHGLEEIKKELGYERSTALERLLIEQIAVCWLQFYYTQSLYALNATSGSLANADYWERRLTLTQVRYLRACETLARVRRLMRPIIGQLNIGARQLNVAQTATSDKPAHELDQGEIENTP
jgi:hypothetical protein